MRMVERIGEAAWKEVRNSSKQARERARREGSAVAMDKSDFDI